MERAGLDDNRTATMQIGASNRLGMNFAADIHRSPSSPTQTMVARKPSQSRIGRIKPELFKTNI
jgi:hypothetical protein